MTKTEIQFRKIKSCDIINQNTHICDNEFIFSELFCIANNHEKILKKLNIFNLLIMITDQQMIRFYLDFLLEKCIYRSCCIILN